MPDASFTLHDISVTLAGTEIAVSGVEFDSSEVVLERADWNEEVAETILEIFATGDDVQRLTISAPDREFRLPVSCPETRRRVNSDGPALAFEFQVPCEAYAETHINPD